VALFGKGLLWKINQQRYFFVSVRQAQRR